ncbi:MAG: alpha-N-acetylglucosaminidase N-terminal domain-containing protein, partial [Gemmatimonadota bacterium]
MADLHRTTRSNALALALSLALAPAAHAASAQSPPSRADQIGAATALIGRVVPDAAAHFRVGWLPIEEGRDVFEVESVGSDVVLRGSSGVAIASALKWYLENVVGTNIAIPVRPLHLPAPLPAVSGKVRVTTPYRYRYFFN